jgi:hypothetical protein
MAEVADVPLWAPKPDVRDPNEGRTVDRREGRRSISTIASSTIGVWPFRLLPRWSLRAGAHLVGERMRIARGDRLSDPSVIF